MQSVRPKNKTINNQWTKIEKFNGTYLPTLKKFPIITKNSKICLVGSCFAERAEMYRQRHLADESIDFQKLERDLDSIFQEPQWHIQRQRFQRRMDLGWPQF